jgi:hypothetical protein
MAGKNGHNGNGATPAETPAELPLYERIRIMRQEGWEQTFTTGRRVRLRTLEPDVLLREGDCPDVLTPLLLKCLYGSRRDDDVREFLDTPLGTKEDAFAYMDLLNLICAKSICDGTKVEELTLAEKRLIFRFALGSSELLTSFVYEPPSVVAAVAQSDDLSQAAE